MHDPGRYTVTLTVSDPDGKQDSTSKVIQVGSAEAVFDHIVISPSNATIQPGGSQLVHGGGVRYRRPLDG